MRFSERMGIVPVRRAIQIDSLDSETRNALWNVLVAFLDQAKYVRENNEYATTSIVYREIWTDLYHMASDAVPNQGAFYASDDNDCYYNFFRNKVLSGKWFECLDFVDFIATCPNCDNWLRRSYDHIARRNLLSVPSPEAFNQVFRKYMVGYRFVNNILTPISNEMEVVSVEGALKMSCESVQEQLTKALRFLSDRNRPEYAKSVDCSISAVEAQCRILLIDPNPTLGKALKLLKDKGIPLHGSLKAGFEKLYGFTSDADGIRHAGLNPSNVDVDLAKFMLVACSAFVNYLRSKGV